MSPVYIGMGPVAGVLGEECCPICANYFKMVKGFLESELYECTWPYKSAMLSLYCDLPASAAIASLLFTNPLPWHHWIIKSTGCTFQNLTRSSRSPGYIFYE